MKNKTILLAEDETVIAMDIKGMLKKIGVQNILIYNDGEELLKKALLEPPDLIVADIKLKNKTSGTKSAEKIWEKYNVPFIFISAVNTSLYKKKYDPSKCEFLKKPFREAELIGALNRLLKDGNSNKLAE